MKLDSRITTFSAVTSLAMIAVVVSVSFLSFRQFTIAAESKHIQALAETVKVGLTELMEHDVFKARDRFLSRLAEVQGVKAVHVVRAPSVTQQFGKGLLREMPQDQIETDVMREGRPYFGMANDPAGMYFRGTIPYVATKASTPSCMGCHEEKEGTVLGAITVSVSMTDMMSSAYQTAAVMALVIVAFMLVVLFFFRRLLRPVIATARDVQETVRRAIQGDFQATIQRRTGDEIGQVADDLNSLLNFIKDGLTAISQAVSELLVQTNRRKDENLLTSTINRVEGLIDAAHFRQAIEEDETKGDIYVRLAFVLQGRFGIKTFSIYEVVEDTITPVSVDGHASASCHWCDPQILARADHCRARRTGHTISSTNSPGICAFFRPPTDGPAVIHTCVPIV